FNQWTLRRVIRVPPASADFLPSQVANIAPVSATKIEQCLFLRNQSICYSQRYRPRALITTHRSFCAINWDQFRLRSVHCTDQFITMSQWCSSQCSQGQNKMFLRRITRKSNAPKSYFRRKTPSPKE